MCLKFRFLLRETSRFVTRKVTNGDAGGDKDCSAVYKHSFPTECFHCLLLAIFFVWELKRYYFLLKLKSSGWCIKTSSTVWAAWSRIKSTRSARRCNSTECLVDKTRRRRIEESEIRTKITRRNQIELLIKCINWTLSHKITQRVWHVENLNF